MRTPTYNKIIISATLVFVAIFTTVGLMSYMDKREAKYVAAVGLYENKEYRAAMLAFKELGVYWDSSIQAAKAEACLEYIDDLEQADFAFSCGYTEEALYRYGALVLDDTCHSVLNMAYVEERLQLAKTKMLLEYSNKVLLE